MPKKKTEDNHPLVHGDMTVQEITDTFPSAAEVLAEWGLGCSMCHIGEIESIEEGAMAHGFTDEEVQEIIHDLNEAAKEDAAEKKEKE
jgi:hybrid cluster-associated redox disulfide protein